jgi:glycosyltransferase involved in cell wall biosynthesis
VELALELDAVHVVIPAFNEEHNLPELLALLAPLGLGGVIVADNGSTDRTAELARAGGATVVAEQAKGYGAACWAGICALPAACRVVVFCDADLADDPRRLLQLVGPILRDEAELVIGARPAELREPGAMTPQQAFGNRLATTLIRLGWGHRYIDLGPFRAIRRDALDRIAMRDRRYGWTVEMQVRALEERLRIVELRLPYRRRAAGRSKISGTLKGSALAGYWILRTIGVLWLRRFIYR